MELGDKFTHKYTLTNTCEITGFTNRGYKVQLTEGKKKPKQAFFDKPDFDVKNGFWVKEIQLDTPVINQQVESKELKYPAFRDFLAAISTNNIPKKKDVQMLDVQLSDNSLHYFYSDFSLDGIRVRITWSKWNRGLCSITISGLQTQKFSANGYEEVMNEAIKWLYEKHFKYAKDEKALFRVYKQGYLGFDYYEFPQYFDFVNNYNFTNYDDVIKQLNRLELDMKTLFIQKVLYNYASFKTELLKLEL